eukprot:2873445-Pyramimonas_sp.AAC.1
METKVPDVPQPRPHVGSDSWIVSYIGLCPSRSSSALTDMAKWQPRHLRQGFLLSETPERGGTGTIE